jgi:chitinase
VTATSLSFAPGQTRKTVSVQSFGIAQPRITTNFRLVLSSPTGATLADATGYGYLVAAQGPPQATVLAASAAEGDSGTVMMNFTMRLSAATTAPVTFKYSTANGTAVAGTDYQATSGSVVVPAGATTAQVPVAVLGNTATQANRTFTLQLTAATNGLRSNTAATGTILDDDGGHVPTPPAPAVYIGDTYIVRGTDPATGPSAVFNVWLTQPATTTTSVQYSTTNGSAIAGADYATTTGTATIAAGQTQTLVSVPARGVAGSAPTVFFKVLLSAPVGAVLGDGTGIAYLSADVGTPQVSPRDAAASEGGAGTTTLTFPIELTAPAAKPVTITYATADGTATVAAGDYQAKTGTVTIAAGATSIGVPVTINGNTTPQANRTFSLKVTAVSGGSAIDTAAIGTIVDDD